MLIVAFALTIKAVVPTGYMLGSMVGARTISVMLCADQNAESVRIAIPADGSQDEDHHKAKDGSCAFSALSFGAVGGADALLLSAVLDHIIALGFAPVTTPVLQGFFHLRPPLRGPPLLS